MIDAEDWPLVAPYHWYAHRDTSGRYYVRANVKRGGRQTTLLLHRVVTRAPKGMEVDHIHHDWLDNRKSQLKVCTQAENGENRKGPASHNRSGILGVCWYPQTHRWRAHITTGGKMRSSYHATKEEAIAARKQMEAERSARNC